MKSLNYEIASASTASKNDRTSLQRLLGCNSAKLPHKLYVDNRLTRLGFIYAVGRFLANEKSKIVGGGKKADENIIDVDWSEMEIYLVGDPNAVIMVMDGLNALQQLDRSHLGEQQDAFMQDAVEALDGNKDVDRIKAMKEIVMEEEGRLGYDNLWEAYNAEHEALVDDVEEEKEPTATSDLKKKLLEAMVKEADDDHLIDSNVESEDEEEEAMKVEKIEGKVGGALVHEAGRGNSPQSQLLRGRSAPPFFGFC
jgi:hypothetical protein